jgi:putative colanic acid biosynthesis glycosyltransferase
LGDHLVRILQINSVCGTGSTGRIATDLYKVLEAYGHECVIGFGRGVAPENIKSLKIGSNLNNYLHVFKTRTTDKHGFGSISVTKNFIKKVREFKPDIIHLHNIHGYYINVEVLFNYLKDLEIPIFWTLHDCWAFTGHCSHFDYVNCNKWETSCFKCPQKKEYPASLWDNSKFNFQKKKELFCSVKNMTIITPSKWLAELTRKSFLGKYPVKVINNGIDLGEFKPIASNFRANFNLQDKFVILGVANHWNDLKGLNTFLELSEKLNKSYQIVLVGVSEKQKKKLPRNIIGITKTNNVIELAEIYSASNVFINPTLQDTFPTTNIESIACGTPVITFNTGGSVEILDSKTGVVIERGNISTLITVIKEFSRYDFSKENCINRSRLYDKNDRYLDYLNLYIGDKNESSIFDQYTNSL